MEKVKALYTAILGQMAGHTKKLIAAFVAGLLVITSYLHYTGVLLDDGPKSPLESALDLTPSVAEDIPVDSAATTPSATGDKEPTCPKGTLDVMGDDGNVIGCFLSAGGGKQ